MFAQIPVYVGCNDPLLGDRKPFNDYHGKDGFGDVPDDDAPDASYIKDEHAVSALSRISKENEGKIPFKNRTLLCIHMKCRKTCCSNLQMQ